MMEVRRRATKVVPWKVELERLNVGATFAHILSYSQLSQKRPQEERVRGYQKELEMKEREREAEERFKGGYEGVIGRGGGQQQGYEGEVDETVGHGYGQHGYEGGQQGAQQGGQQGYNDGGGHQGHNDFRNLNTGQPCQHQGMQQQ